MNGRMEFNYVLRFSLSLRANLSLVQEMGDGASQGRTYGNLGNTYYLLGDFEKAVSAHEKVSGYLCSGYHTRVM
jgi:hypothetical protein